MLKPTQLLDTRPRDHSDGVIESRPSIHSPSTVNSSAPVSPVISLFSAKGHTRLSSSVSSLVSLSGLGNSTETSKPQLTDVREEDFVASETRDLEDDYFQHFDQGMSVNDESYFFAFGEYPDGYDLTDAGMDVPRSPKKRRSDNASVKGISRIGSRISTMSSRWRSKRSSDGQMGDDISPEELRSRANSASSTMVNPTISSLTRLDSRMPPSPARTLFEERLSEASVYPIDIAKANSPDVEDCVPKSTTPLLPPFMRDSCASATPSTVHSPLQSPSVADVSHVDDDDSDAVAMDPRTAGVPSPPLSTKPSVASFCRHPGASLRTVSGEARALLLTSPNDQWAHKLGHANFTIQPEPYEPEVCEPAAFEQLRSDWDAARCNFARHLVRTGEHYGVTSNIYKLTEEKWESISREWRRIHDAMLTRLQASGAFVAPLAPSDLRAGKGLRLPRLHDTAKFPELGDGEIVGPMSVAPAIATQQGSCRTRTLRKRNFFRFFQDLVSSRS